MATKVFKYNTSATFAFEGEQLSIATQLYQVGIYVIVNGHQTTLTAKGAQKLFNEIKKDFASGKIQNLVLGREIAVFDDGGLLKEVE